MLTPLGASWLATALLLLLSALPFADASALTTTIAANERTCFYALVDKASEKVMPSSPLPPAPSGPSSHPLVVPRSASTLP